MSMTPGTRLGPYEIVEIAGTGGMGDVYRAKDVRLDRDVAVKTLKGPFTERFEREAHAISSLNHPNICTLFDVGQHDGSGYLVMEFIEGRPIAGPMPVDQAVVYGIQICEALHAAHRKGIIHRDLKPANILVTKQGIKLLDFGLAKLAASMSAGSEARPSGVEQATMSALTGAHTVVGTPQYMAPEQIEALPVDARTDIFAFGCVLYELITGHRAFDGQTPSSVMAAVLATKPRPIEELVPLTPPALERIVSRCLAKDPEDRWHTARDVAAELQWVAQGGSKVGLPAVVSGRRKVREHLAWAAFAVATLAAVGFAVAWNRRAPAPEPLVRFAFTVPAGVQNPSPPVVSPDGRHIAFAAELQGKREVWIRPLDALEARPLAGTEGVLRPFWSPDSRFVAFMAGGKLKKVDISGGPPQTICDAQYGADGSWSPEGVILFDGRGTDPIWRVPAAGGVRQPLSFGKEVTEGTAGAGWPEFLPDGRHFLFTLIDPTSPEMTLMVGALDSTEVKPLFKTTTRVQYAEPGYLLFVRDQTLVAQKFDLGSQSLVGEPLPLGEGLGTDNLGLASFSASETGVLVFRGGEVTGTRVVWVDRSGKETAAIETAGNYADASISPDGNRFLYDLAEGGNTDIWIRDVVRNVPSRFTYDAAQDIGAMWTPDGRRVIYTSTAKGPGDLYVKDASGTREAEPLVVDGNAKYASDVSRDGRQLLFTVRTAGDTSWDIWALSMAGGGKPVPVVQTRFFEAWATFSPDGKYIAYQSNESGRSEIYVQEFPEAINKVRVSTSGGAQVFWRADGRELFYRTGTAVMSVPVQAGPHFVPGAPAKLFDMRFAAPQMRAHYRPTRDGQRFIVIAPLTVDAEQPAVVVLNWASALGKR